MKTLILTLIFFLLVLVSCGTFDTKNTAQLYKYPPPVLSNLKVSDTTVKVTIDINMYYPNHEDFQYYIILVGDKGVNFNAGLQDLGDLTTVNTIPNYFASTTKPSAAGSYLNSLEFSANISNFTSLESYDMVAIAYGINESAGKLFENNGWLYSDISDRITFHIPKVMTGSISNLGASGVYSVIIPDNNREWVISTSNENENGIYLASISYGETSSPTSDPIFVTGTSGNVGMQMLGYLSADEVISIPTDNFVVGNPSSSFYYSLPENYYFALKNIANNTYGKLLITSKEKGTFTSNTGGVPLITSFDVVHFKLTYSTVANEHEF